MREGEGVNRGQLVGMQLADRGFDSLDAYAGVENLEERMWPDGSRIDPAVLEMLRS